MTKTEWKFAVLLSATLTVFTMIDKKPEKNAEDWGNMFLTSLLIFIFLLLNWFVNSRVHVNIGKYRENKISLQKFILLIVCNLFLLFFLVASIIPILDRMNYGGIRTNYTYVIIIFRGVVGICLIYIIQMALYSTTKAQSVLLQNQMLQTENIRSQLEILKQQISPHFLFNSLATLRSMIRLNNPHSEQFVMKLSEIYRQLLIKRQLDSVTVRDELCFVNDYLFMLSARFEKMLSINIDIPDEILLLKVPTFSLQLLIENCMKHNIVSREKPLSIRIFCPTADTLAVENNLQAKVSQVKKSGYGLENLDQRYNLLGWPDSVTVNMDDNVFSVKLKLLKI